MNYSDLEIQRRILINQSNQEIQELCNDLKSFFQNKNYHFSNIENKIFFDIQLIIQDLQAKTIEKSDLPDVSKKLYYHNSRHNLELAKRTIKIFKVLNLTFKLSLRLLLQVFFHDSILVKNLAKPKTYTIDGIDYYYYLSQSEESNENKSAENLSYTLKQLNHSLEFDFFSDLEIEADRKAILNTSVDFDLSLQTVKSVALRDLSNLKLENILLHLVDLGGSGIGELDKAGILITKFGQEGDECLLENVVVPTLSYSGSIPDQKSYPDFIPDQIKFVLAHRILSWSKEQVSFAKGQKILLNQTLTALQANQEITTSQVQILKSKVFNAFELSQSEAMQKVETRERLFQDFYQKYQQKMLGDQEIDLHPSFYKLLQDIGL